MQAAARPVADRPPGYALPVLMMIFGSLLTPGRKEV
jgi:hypothetical protein